MKTAILTAILASLAAAVATAETIVYDFDGGTPAAVTSNSFPAGVVAHDTVIPLGSSGDNGNDGTYSTALAKWTPSTNVKARVSPRGNAGTEKLSFSVDIPAGVAVDFTAIDFEFGFNENSGGPLIPNWDLTISTGSATPSFGGLSGHNGTGWYVNDPNPTSVTLSGLTGLTDTTVTFEWIFTTDAGNNHGVFFRSFTLDDITLTGTVGIPAPKITKVTNDGSENLTLDVANLVDGEMYHLETSDTLPGFDPLAGSEFTASGTTDQRIVNDNGDPIRFVRVVSGAIPPL